VLLVGSGMGPTGRLSKVHPAVGLVAWGTDASLQVPVTPPPGSSWATRACCLPCIPPPPEVVVLQVPSGSLTVCCWCW
jgi:hypothetical protein